tara:strand:- start:2971 stop:3678 length:708 start_codon:yes stop_codon:yes gene_type:complete
MNFLKEKLKFFLSKCLSLSVLSRLKQNIIWRKIINKKNIRYLSRSSKKLPHEQFNKRIRNVVWDEAAKFIGENSKVLYIELGVWEGYSIEYFSKIFKNKESTFHGFDTFTGMPENWRHMDQGHYDQTGNIPKFQDNRIKLHKGMFQDTLENFLKDLKIDKDTKVIINFDCVLYTSTLFCLFKIDKYFENYYFLFDEFYGDECRAFSHFTESNKKDYELFFASESNYAPEVLFGRF